MRKPKPKKELVLCGHESPLTDCEDCPREDGHKGDHVYWNQSVEEGSKKKNGVWIVDEKGNALVHMDVRGHVVAEEVSAMLALMEYWKEARQNVQP